MARHKHKRRLYAIRRIVAGFALISAAVTHAGNRFAPQTVADFKVSSAIYVISDNIDLAGGVLSVPKESTLVFNGGAICNGRVVFNGTTISAPDYCVFRGIDTFSGTVTNHEINADWFDAASDCSGALKKIVALGENRSIHLPRQMYKLASTVIVDKRNIEIVCGGKIVVNEGRCTEENCAFDLRQSFAVLRLGQLMYENGAGGTEYSPGLSAIRLSGNVYHATIDIGVISRFNIGIDLRPTIRNRSVDKNGVGVQYGKFYWQQINCSTGIMFDLWRNKIPAGMNKSASSTVWINENQFFGGRLVGKRGIAVNRVNPVSNEKADIINGNVFNSIGFEGITEKPMSLYGMTFCEFNDIRMSESLPEGDTSWIDLDRCSFLNFKLKSILYHKRVHAVRSHQITFYGCFTDKGLNYATGNTVMFVNNSNPSRFMTDSEASSTMISTSHLKNRNIAKRIYFDVNTVPNKGTLSKPIRKRRISFDEMFAKTYDGQIILSESCLITLYDQVELEVCIDKSLISLKPEMTLFCDLHNHSTITFIKSDKTIFSIDGSGTYKLTYDNNDLKLQKL